MQRETEKGKSLSIRAKIALGSLVVVLLVWSVLAALSYSATNALLQLTSQHLFNAAAKEISLEVQATYRPVEQMTVLLANSRLASANTFAERFQTLPLLADMLRVHPQAIAIQAGYANGDYFNLRQLTTEQLRENVQAPAQAVFSVDQFPGERDKPSLRLFYDGDLNPMGELLISNNDYDPRERPWYIDATNSDKSITTAPYLFYFLRTLGVTVGQRAEDPTTVIATDLTLSSIGLYLSAQRVTPGTEILLHRGDGVIAFSGDNNLVVVGDEVRQRQLSDLNTAPFNSLNSAVLPKGWLVHRQSLVLANALAQSDKLELIIAVPEKELLSEFVGIRDRILLYSFALLFLLVPLAWWLASGLSKPIRELHAAIAGVDKKTFDLKLPPIRSNDEVGALNHALKAMSEALHQYIDELATATAARLKLEGELDIARRIQMDLVPGGGELTVNLGDDKLYACLKPARAVGGDLYEMLALDDGRYFIAVGDVSDKGMPAALFMSRAVALAKMLAPRATTTADMLAELNNELVKGNDSCMFITLFCGFYQPQTGELCFASAGHNPPVLLSERGAGFIELTSGTALGVFENVQYHNQRLQLKSGEQLCVYTDGITEAFNAKREEFSEERLLRVLSEDENDSSHVRERGELLLAAVKTFAADEAQSDDITLMILGRH